MAFFAIPFVLIGGVIMLVGVWQKIAEMRVSTPELTVSNASPRVNVVYQNQS